MRIIKVILIVSIFISACSNPTANNNDGGDSTKEKLIIKEAVERIKPQELVDTLSFNYFLELTNSFNDIPQYFVDSFIPKKLTDNEDLYRAYYGTEDKSYIFHDIYVSSISIGVYGVCSYSYLITYDNSGRIIDDLRIGDGCDRDMSDPYYSYSYSSIYADSIIEIVYIQTKDIDDNEAELDSLSKIIDGAEITKEEYKYYILSQSGNFNRIITRKFIDGSFHASYKILSENDLIELSYEELKLLRNEIFARKGYIFKSKELIEYFSNQNWYKPLYSDVNFILSPIELYNINLIKSIEIDKIL